MSAPCVTPDLSYEREGAGEVGRRQYGVPGIHILRSMGWKKKVMQLLASEICGVLFFFSCLPDAFVGSNCLFLFINAGSVINSRLTFATHLIPALVFFDQ